MFLVPFFVCLVCATLTQVSGTGKLGEECGSCAIGLSISVTLCYSATKGHVTATRPPYLFVMSVFCE